jgi:hypothetical protein
MKQITITYIENGKVKSLTIQQDQETALCNGVHFESDPALADISWSQAMSVIITPTP